MRNVYISFGENCLTDNILKRNGLKSFSTPYANCRSNIEYVLQMERDGFSGLLNPENLQWATAGTSKVLRSTKYQTLQNFYDPAHMCGYEFTHYDVINNVAHRDAVQLRCDRLLNLGKEEEIFLNIFYFHRDHINTDMYMLIDHLNELKEIYEERCKYVRVILFQQIIVQDDALRRLEHRVINGIHVYSFFVRNKWGGTDPNLFWAQYDDDLITQMISSVVEVSKSETAQVEPKQNKLAMNSQTSRENAGILNKIRSWVKGSKVQ